MSTYLPFIIIGLTTGSIFGIAALGLVLTYKTTGLFNFGHGAVAASAAVLFYSLHHERGWPWPLAAAVAIAVFGVGAGLVIERMASALADVATAYRIVATLGLILIVPSVTSLILGPQARPFAPFLSQASAFKVSGVKVGWDAVTVSTLGLVSAVALFTYFRRSRLGMTMRAVVDSPELLNLTGEDPDRIRRIAWIIGCSFAAVCGILLANMQQQLDATFLSLLVVQAFGAAAMGSFTSLPLAYAGGLALGVAQAVAGRLTVSHSWMQGLNLNMPFLFLFVALLVIPKGRLVELGQRVKPRPQPGPLFPARYRLPASLAGVAAALALPFLVGTNLPTWNAALAQLLLFLSLGLLVHTSGQNSLCQVGFAAIGATTFAHTLGFGFPWALAVLIGGLVAVPVGALVAVPAIRLSGLYLALATLGFGILLAQFFYSKSFMFGPLAGLPTARPHMMGLDSERGYYYVLLAFGLAGIGLVLAVERSRLGRLLRGLSNSPTALSAMGANVNVTRVLVFCISAFLAGVSGALSAGLFATIAPDNFSYVQSLIVLAALMVCGRRTIPAAVIAAIAFTVPGGYLSGDNVVDWAQLVFGAAVVLVGVFGSGRLTRTFERMNAELAWRRVGSRTALRRPDALASPVGDIAAQ